jgi:hypothetical protein
MTIPSLRMLPDTEMRQLRAACERGQALAQPDTALAFLTWLVEAPEPVIQHFGQQLRRLTSLGEAVPTMDAALWHQVTERCRQHQEPCVTAVASSDAGALNAWVARQAHPCLVEGALRTALSKGHLHHVPLLVAEAECVNPDLVVLRAWEANKPVPLAWAMHWFTQLPSERQTRLVEPCLKAAITHQRLAWMEALAAHADHGGLTPDWSMLLAGACARWAEGVEWMASQGKVDLVTHMERKVNLATKLDGPEHLDLQNEANWLMCRLPVEARAQQLERWHTEEPGFFKEAEAYHDAENRFQQAAEHSPKHPRRHRHRA